VVERPKRVPYAEVAEIVRQNQKRYAPLIAERYGVPRTTAQRWAREARLRGYLAPVEERVCRTCGGTGVTRYGSGTRKPDLRSDLPT
jgi:hypothetical protein